MPLEKRLRENSQLAFARFAYGLDSQPGPDSFDGPGSDAVDTLKVLDAGESPATAAVVDNPPGQSGADALQLRQLDPVRLVQIKLKTDR